MNKARARADSMSDAKQCCVQKLTTHEYQQQNPRSELGTPAAWRGVASLPTSHDRSGFGRPPTDVVGSTSFIELEKCTKTSTFSITVYIFQEWNERVPGERNTYFGTIERSA